MPLDLDGLDIQIEVMVSHYSIRQPVFQWKQARPKLEIPT